MKKIDAVISLAVLCCIMAACGESSSTGSDEERCSLADILPESNIRWSDMLTYETGAQYCDAGNLSSMTAADLNEFTEAMAQRGFEYKIDEKSMNYYSYEFTRSSADTTVTLTFDYDLTDGALVLVTLKKDVQQFVRGDIDRLVKEHLYPHLDKLTGHPSLISWTGDIRAISIVEPASYIGKNSAALDQFVIQIASDGWENIVIGFSSGIWSLGASRAFNGTVYNMVVEVYAVDGYSGTTWDDAVSIASTNKFTIKVSKI